MKKVTKEQLDEIMRNWIAYCDALKIHESSREYVACEQAFVFGAACQILGVPVTKINWDMLPPIVGMCFSSARPLSSVGNWDTNAPEQRIAT